MRQFFFQMPSGSVGSHSILTSAHYLKVWLQLYGSLPGDGGLYLVEEEEDMPIRLLLGVDQLVIAAPLLKGSAQRAASILEH